MKVPFRINGKMHGYIDIDRKEHTAAFAPTCDKCGQAVEVNADGDSLEAITSVWKEKGEGSIDVYSLNSGDWRAAMSLDTILVSFGAMPPNLRPRIYAKYANEFVLRIHRWDHWREGVEKRGLVFRHDHMGTVSYFVDGGGGVRADWTHDHCDDTCRWSAITKAEMQAEIGAGNVYEKCMDFETWARAAAWTAINCEQYDAETKPADPEVVPWTAETFPKDRPVWVRYKTWPEDSAELITYYCRDGARVEGKNPTRGWAYLLANHVQHDAQPCGTRKDGE